MKAPAVSKTLCANTTDTGSSAGNKYGQTTHAHTAHKTVHIMRVWT